MRPRPAARARAREARSCWPGEPSPAPPPAGDARDKTGRTPGLSDHGVSFGPRPKRSCYWLDLLICLAVTDGSDETRTHDLRRDRTALFCEARSRDSGEQSAYQRALGGTAGGTTTRERGPTLACADPRACGCTPAPDRGYLPAERGKTADFNGEGGIRTPDGRKRPYRFSRP